MKFQQISQAVLLLIQRWISNEHMVFRDTVLKKKPKIVQCFFFVDGRIYQHNRTVIGK